MSIHLEILQEKTRILNKLQDEIEACKHCEALCTTRTRTVFGDGNLNARIVFLGEAPGADEDVQGKPFVGRAGKLLDNILEAHGINRSDVYICNILKCRPPKNRVPEDEEMKNCAGYLETQLNVINPKFIVCLGSTSSRQIVGLPIGRARGQWFQYKKHKVICTYHPAFLLRNPAAKKDVAQDMEMLSIALRE